MARDLEEIHSATWILRWNGEEETWWMARLSPYLVSVWQRMDVDHGVVALTADSSGYDSMLLAD